MDSAPRPSAGGTSLDALDALRPARILKVDALAAGQPAERGRQLAEIGFFPGETVCVLARAWPGGDPLLARVGDTCFALRRAEAVCVVVEAPR